LRDWKEAENTKEQHKIIIHGEEFWMTKQELAEEFGINGEELERI